MSNTVHLDKIRNRLAKIWFIGSAFPFLLMVLQTLLGKYEPKTQEAWSWFIPLVFPTLALMIGVMGAEAFMERRKRVVSKGFSLLTCGLSFGYLFVLFIVILLEPFSSSGPSKVYSMSSFFLAPVQGIVVAAIGYLFTGEAKMEEAEPQRSGS